MSYSKREREREYGMPKKNDPKKGTHEGPSVEKKFGHMKVQEKKGEYIY